MLLMWLFFVNIMSFKLNFICILLNLIDCVEIKYLQFFIIIFLTLITFFIAKKILLANIDILLVYISIISY